MLWFYSNFRQPWAKGYFIDANGVSVEIYNAHISIAAAEQILKEKFSNQIKVVPEQHLLYRTSIERDYVTGTKQN